MTTSPDTSFIESFCVCRLERSSRVKSSWILFRLSVLVSLEADFVRISWLVAICDRNWIYLSCADGGRGSLTWSQLPELNWYWMREISNGLSGLKIRFLSDNFWERVCSIEICFSHSVVTTLFLGKVIFQSNNCQVRSLLHFRLGTGYPLNSLFNLFSIVFFLCWFLWVANLRSCLTVCNVAPSVPSFQAGRMRHQKKT